MSAVEIDSILDSVKKKLGGSLDSPQEFDADLIDAINAALSILTQIGVGPKEGFVIHDNTETWSDFTKDQLLLIMVRSYVYVRVRLLFDPPQSSFALTSLQDLAKEYEWRLNVYTESPQTFGPIRF